jgi:hypothetical protein
MKRRMITFLFVLVLALFVTGLALAAAQYNLLAWTVESGGGRIQATPYILFGSIGQPEVGVLSGGSYTLTGGFLGAGEPTPTPAPIK